MIATTVDFFRGTAHLWRLAGQLPHRKRHLPIYGLALFAAGVAGSWAVLPYLDDLLDIDPLTEGTP